MSDYVSCPSCGGRGLLPLEETSRIEAHRHAAFEEMAENQMQEARKRREVQAQVQQDLVARRMRDAEQRLAELTRVVQGGTPVTGPDDSERRLRADRGPPD